LSCRHNIPPELRVLIRSYERLLSRFDNETIRQAVNEWCLNRNNALMLYGPISQWDTSGVTDMSTLFMQKKTFNDNIERWDVSKVTTMQNMFSSAEMFNQPINRWDIQSVKNLSYMFSSNQRFNQPLNQWDVKNVSDMSFMFFHSVSFNQLLDDWKVDPLCDIRSMFVQNTKIQRPKWYQRRMAPKRRKKY
jgi:hypothetical protein